MRSFIEFELYREKLFEFVLKALTLQELQGPSADRWERQSEEHLTTR